MEKEVAGEGEAIRTEEPAIEGPESKVVAIEGPKELAIILEIDT